MRGIQVTARANIRGFSAALHVICDTCEDGRFFVGDSLSKKGMLLPLRRLMKK